MIKMKRLLLILLFTSYTFQLQADIWESNIYRKIGYGYAVGAMLSSIAFDQFYYTSDRNNNGLYISPGFDPKMALDKYADLRLKMFYHYNKFEPSITYEFVGQDIQYQGISLGVDYLLINRKLSLLGGIETTRIYNRNPSNLQIVQSFGTNTEIRYLINNKLSVSYVGNIKTRPDITKQIVYSGYLSLNCSIDFLIEGVCQLLID